MIRTLIEITAEDDFNGSEVSKHKSKLEAVFEQYGFEPKEHSERSYRNFSLLADAITRHGLDPYKLMEEEAERRMKAPSTNP